MTNWNLIEGDCIEAMSEMPSDSVDSVVCDPPYNFSFMGKAWDKHDTPLAFQKWCQDWATEAFRVLKPGGHMLAFGGTRTVHRLAVAIEDAGFEIRDQIVWLYGSGFPKSHDVSKGIDKAAGAEREVVGTKPGLPGLHRSRANANHFTDDQWKGSDESARNITAPATPEAQKWQGWGTALKPAHVPIIVSRKPLIGTVAKNVTQFGCGAMNIDGTRIGVSDADAAAMERCNTPGSGRFKASEGSSYGRPSPSPPLDTTQGRWPANVLLDPEAGAMLDAQSGETPSRFFYCAKSSSSERNAGLDGVTGARIGAKGNGLARTCSTCNASVLDGCDCPDRTYENPVRKNHHPTVKPLALMRYLIRLVTPPGGRVLDPFTGSGTTGIAATLEGFDFVGVEREAEYAEIAEARIEWWSKQAGDTAEILERAGLAEKAEAKHRDVGQLGLLD